MFAAGYCDIQDWAHFRKDPSRGGGTFRQCALLFWTAGFLSFSVEMLLESYMPKDEKSHVTIF